MCIKLVVNYMHAPKCPYWLLTMAAIRPSALTTEEVDETTKQPSYTCSCN